jgi:hypothetical protein
MLRGSQAVEESRLVVLGPFEGPGRGEGPVVLEASHTPRPVAHPNQRVTTQAPGRGLAPHPFR